MTLCPNCGNAIAEEDLDFGCWTCGFTARDVKTRNEKRETEEETKSINSLYNVSRLSSSVLQTGEDNAE